MHTQKPALDPMISSPDSNEYFNAISHLVGAILSLAGLIVLVTFAALEQQALHIISFAIYGSSLVLSFVASCLLHFFLLFGKYKRVFGILDHCAIYLLIAGTYTPFCLVVLQGAAGWWLFGIIWSLTIFFIVIKAIFFAQLPIWLSNLSYLLLGWLILPFAGSIVQILPIQAIVLMIIGGLCFSLGAISFALGKPNPFPPNFGNHEIWHIAVLCGNFAFFLVMLQFVLPLH